MRTMCNSVPSGMRISILSLIAAQNHEQRFIPRKTFIPRAAASIHTLLQGIIYRTAIGRTGTEGNAVIFCHLLPVNKPNVEPVRSGRKMGQQIPVDPPIESVRQREVVAGALIID